MTKGIGPSCAGRLQEADFCSFTGHDDQPPAPRGREKRRSLRFPHEEPVVLETQEGEMVGAVVMNYGKNGLYFESNLKVRRGMILRICNESSLAHQNGGGCRAEVRWSKRLGFDPAEYVYGAGVRYCGSKTANQKNIRQRTAA
jgi:hypothetical protein